MSASALFTPSSSVGLMVRQVLQDRGFDPDRTASALCGILKIRSEEPELYQALQAGVEGLPGRRITRRQVEAFLSDMKKHAGCA